MLNAYCIFHMGDCNWSSVSVTGRRASSCRCAIHNDRHASPKARMPLIGKPGNVQTQRPSFEPPFAKAEAWSRDGKSICIWNQRESGFDFCRLRDEIRTRFFPGGGGGILICREVKIKRQQVLNKFARGPLPWLE